MHRPTSRAVGIALILSLTLLACSRDRGSDVPTPPPSGPPTTATPATVSPGTGPTGPTNATTSPPVEPTHLKLPDDGPSLVDDPRDIAAIEAGDLTALAPPGAAISFRQVLARPEDPLDQIAFAWDRGKDFFAAEHGVVIWQWFADASAWRAVYAFTDPADGEVLGIQPFRSDDLTSDGFPELLTFEDTGGSGACGTTRVISSTPGAANEIFRGRACDTEIAIVDGSLEVREAVFGPDDAHCCPSSFRISTLGWDGSRFVEIDSRVEPA